jgi:hypothetical protein
MVERGKRLHHLSPNEPGSAGSDFGSSHSSRYFRSPPPPPRLSSNNHHWAKVYQNHHECLCRSCWKVGNTIAIPHEAASTTGRFLVMTLKRAGWDGPMEGSVMHENPAFVRLALRMAFARACSATRGFFPLQFTHLLSFLVLHRFSLWYSFIQPWYFRDKTLGENIQFSKIC